MNNSVVELLVAIWDYKVEQSKFEINPMPKYILINNEWYFDLLQNSMVFKYIEPDIKNPIKYKFAGIKLIRTNDIEKFEIV